VIDALSDLGSWFMILSMTKLKINLALENPIHLLKCINLFVCLREKTRQ
jgi:hypothetical protein